MGKALVAALALALVGACEGGPGGGPRQPYIQRGLYQTLRLHNAAVTGLAFSPDGKWLASASVDGTVRITDWKAQKPVADLGGPTEKGIPYPVAWTRDGARLLVGGEAVKVYLASDWKEAKKLVGHSWVYAVASADCAGREVIATAGGNDKEIRIWDGQGNLQKTLHPHTNKIYTLAFDSTGSTLASGSWDRTIKLFRTDTWDSTVTLSPGIQASVFSVTFPFAGSSIIAGLENGQVLYWSTPRQDKPPDTQAFLAHSDAAPALAFSTVRRLVATGGYDKRVYLYDEDFHPLRQFFNAGGKVFSLSFSPQGDVLIAGSEDGTVRIWVPQGQ